MRYRTSRGTLVFAVLASDEASALASLERRASTELGAGGGHVAEPQRNRRAADNCDLGKQWAEGDGGTLDQVDIYCQSRSFMSSAARLRVRLSPPRRASARASLSYIASSRRAAESAVACNGSNPEPRTPP